MKKIIQKVRSVFVYESKRYGCGSGIFYIGCEKLFFPACKWHDIQYEKADKSRLIIEWNFLLLMLDAVYRKHIEIIDRKKCILCKSIKSILLLPLILRDLTRALLYFVVVLLIGRLFYKGGPFYFESK